MATKKKEYKGREKGVLTVTILTARIALWSRMEVLRFNGEDLKSWLFKIEE